MSGIVQIVELAEKQVIIKVTLMLDLYKNFAIILKFLFLLVNHPEILVVNDKHATTLPHIFVGQHNIKTRLNNHVIFNYIDDFHNILKCKKKKN